MKNTTFKFKFPTGKTLVRESSAIKHSPRRDVSRANWVCKVNVYLLASEQGNQNVCCSRSGHRVRVRKRPPRSRVPIPRSTMCKTAVVVYEYSSRFFNREALTWNTVGINLFFPLQPTTFRSVKRVRRSCEKLNESCLCSYKINPKLVNAK